MIKLRNRAVAIAVLLITVVLCAVAGLAACGNVDMDSPNPGNNDEYYTVIFYSNYGSPVPADSVKKGSLVARPKDPTRNGYTFGGWFVDSKYTNEWDFNTDVVLIDNIMLYAKWTPEGGGEPDPIPQCTVTFVTNCDATQQPQTLDMGSKVDRPNVSNPGYTLDGWFNGATQWDFDKNVVSTETLTLTAQWTKIPVVQNKCTVVFETNCSATVKSQTLDIGSKVGMPNITNPGYTLDGWFNGDTQWNFADDTVTGSTLTLTARWTKIDTPIIGDDSVTVTFNVGRAARMAGTYNPAAVTVKSGNKVSEPTVKRSGYTLSGWYVDEGTQKWNFANAVTENTTLYAKWTAGGGTVIQYTPTMTNRDTLYIHYLRSDNNYDGWYIYNWSNSGNQEIKNTVAKDASGAVFAINLKDSVNNGLSTIKVIVTQAGWNKDGGDIEVVLSNTQDVNGSKHWYISQGNTAHGGTKPVAANPVGGGTTEPKRASKGNVVRSEAQKLPVMPTVSGWDEMGVGYQIFVASFCDSNGDGVGDINGIISKLNYLQELNVDVLWLTPVQSSPSYHAYDCDDYYNIHEKFGTNADYRKLVSEVHKRGMKIIMDLVVNHTSQDNEWFQKSKMGVIEEVTYQDGSKKTVNYRDFYRWKSGDGGGRYCGAGDGWSFYSSFGSGMPELNYDYQPVRDAMVDVAAYWMSFGLDGMRMDAIKHVFMWDEGDRADSDVEGGADDQPYNYNMNKDIEVFKEINYKLKTKYPHCFLLGEQLSGNTNYVSPFYQGMDSLFDFNTYFDLPQRIKGEKGGVSEQANAFNSNAQKYETNRGDRPINGMITSNHDEPRLSYKLSDDTAKMKLYTAVIMTMPGLSWIYYGDEIGLRSQGENDNTYRQSMKWTSNWANKCTAIQDFSLNGGVKSVAEQDTDENSLLKYVKKLTKFRNDHPTLINGEATCSTQDGMLKIVVTGGGKTYTVYHNFSNSAKSVSGTALFGSNTVPAYGTTVVG